MRKELRDTITAQALQEITFARQYKQGKVTNWQKNENLYQGKKVHSDEARANVDLGLMQSFVHTILSKIDNPLVFKYTKRKQSQLNRVKRLNALREYDAARDDWDIKDIVGKKQAIMYGRAIYSYYADSIDGYKPHLDLVDVYDFLIDPSVGGVDIERALYMGRYGVVKLESELKEGVKRGDYLKYETNQLVSGTGNAIEKTQEEINKDNRTRNTNVFTADKEISNTEKYKFWEWYTTYKGERYYLLLSEKGGTSIRVEKLSDIFKSNLYPFWTWACFPDATDFWTPSYCDSVREPFMAQTVSINQMLDNAEQINKPQKIVDVTMIDDLAKLKYRKDGIIESKGDANRAIKYIETPSITTPIKVYELLDLIQEKSSGVTASAKGIADEDKVGIYEGNQANTADRFGLLNKSYSFGYRRFAKLYEWGIKEHLNKKIAIDIIGPEGVSLEEVSKRDIYWKDDTFGVMVESSNAEIALSENEKRTKILFLQSQAGNPIQNPTKAYEIQASVAGYSDDEIRQLLDVQDFGDAELISEAERDIEMLLDGKQIKPNMHANLAYKQKFVDYMSDHNEDIDGESFGRLVNYINQLEPIIQKTLGKQLANEELNVAKELPVGTGDITQPSTVAKRENINPNLEQNDIRI